MKPNASSAPSTVCTTGIPRPTSRPSSATTSGAGAESIAQPKMSCASALLQELDARGFVVRIEGGRVQASGLLTPRLRAELAACEGELAKIVAARLCVRCPHFEPLPGTARCRSYYPNGACARPDELMCVEWMRANGHTR